MKVLQINSVCGYGSTGRITVDLYRILKEKGMDCCIAYGRGIAPKDVKTIKIGNRIDFYFHALMTRLFDNHCFCSKHATRKFIEQVKEYNPDIILLHNIHGYYINLEILFKYLNESKKKVMWTLHDCWSFTGHCAHFDSVGCQKWKKQCERCPLKREYPQSCLLDLSKRNYKRKKEAITQIQNLIVITPSKWLASVVKQSFLNKYEVEVIANGIDITVFCLKDENQIIEEKLNLKRKYEIDFSKKIFLGVSSIWTKDKGFNDFINIAENISEDIQIVLVGVSKKQKKSLPSNVIGIERTDNQCELASLYSCADVFLNPTYADTFPTVNIEAMACGLPIVTYETGGSVEVADVVVPKGDWMEMMRKAKQLKKTTDRIVQSFEKEKCYQQYLYIIEKFF